MKKNIVVIGNGMVGHRFCLKLLEFNGLDTFNVVVLGEEPRPAYDRVHLTSYFEEGTTDEDLFLCGTNWYSENGFDLRIGVKATDIDRKRKIAVSRLLKSQSITRLSGTFRDLPMNA